MFRPPWFESLLYLWWEGQLDVRKDNSNLTGRFRMFILRDDCSKWHVCNNSPICFRQIILARHQNEIPLDYIFIPFIYYNCQDCECNHLRIFNLHSTSVTHLRSWLCSFCRWDIPGTLNYIFLSTRRTFRKKNSTFFRERNNWTIENLPLVNSGSSQANLLDLTTLIVKVPAASNLSCSAWKHSKTTL